MNFLRKPWVLGGLIGLVLYLIFIFFAKGESISDFLIYFFFFVGAGILAGLGGFSLPFKNFIVKSTLTGGFTGLILYLLALFFSSFSVGDPTGTAFVILIFFPISVGLGAFVGSLVGLSIYIVVRGR